MITKYLLDLRSLKVRRIFENQGILYDQDGTIIKKKKFYYIGNLPQVWRRAIEILKERTSFHKAELEKLLEATIKLDTFMQKEIDKENEKE